MTEIRYVKHGPFRGYVSSQPKHAIGLEDAGPDSRDWLYSPTEGKWVERSGSAIQGDTITTDSVTGLLPTKYSSRARQLVEMPNVKDQDGYDLFADGYPSYGSLMTVETAEVAATTQQTGKGQFYFRSSNSGGSNQVPAKSFSADTYPTTARSGDKSWLKIIPFWHATVDPNRCTTAALREYMYAGSRRCVQVGNWMYFPSLYASPSRWNITFNDSSSTPTRVECHQPIGQIPPLFPARFKNTELPTGTTTVNNWKQGDRFYVSMCWIFEDGSWSMPYIPRPIVNEPELEVAGTADAGGTTTTLVDAARTEANDVWNGYTLRITSGPLRGQSFVVTDFVAASDTIVFAPAAAFAPDTLTYELTPFFINAYGLVTVPRQSNGYTADGSGTSDVIGSSTTTLIDTGGRTEVNDYWIGYTLLITSGALAGQSFTVTGFDAAADTITYSPASSVAPDNMAYELRKLAPTDYYPTLPWRGLPKGPPGVVQKALLRSPKVDAATQAVPDPTDLRITAIIDAATTSYDDPNGDDDSLRVNDELVHFKHIWPPRARYVAVSDDRVFAGYTRENPAAIIVAPTGNTNLNDITAGYHDTMGTVAYTVRVADVGAGSTINFYKIDGGAGFPAAPGTVSVSFSGKTLQQTVDDINAQLFLSGAADCWRAQLAPGADPGVIADLAGATGHTDPYGDDGLVSGGTTKHQQAISQAYPAIIYLRRGAVDGLYPRPDKLGFWHTRANPDTVASGIAAAANYWHGDNYRQPPDKESGTLMGFAPLVEGTVVFYSKKVWLYWNSRDSRTGKDEDFRFTLLSNDGCIAWDSIVSFNDAVGWLSAKGFKVAGRVEGGGFQESLISGAIFNPEERDRASFRIAGNLTYEVEQCIAASAADNDAMEFRARVINSALYIHYRSTSSASKPDMMQIYDYSEGAGSGGLRELFRGDGSPYGWSPPHRLPGSCIGSVRKSTGLVKLHTIDTNAGSTGDGRIDQFDTGYLDNATAVSPLLYMKQDDMGFTDRRHRDQLATLEYKSPTGHTLTMRHSRDRSRASQTNYTMENSGTAELVTQTKRVKLAGQSPARVSEFSFSSTRVTAGPAEIRSLVRKAKILNPRPDGAG